MLTLHQLKGLQAGQFTGESSPNLQAVFSRLSSRIPNVRYALFVVDSGREARSGVISRTLESRQARLVARLAHQSCLQQTVRVQVGVPFRLILGGCKAHRVI